MGLVRTLGTQLALRALQSTARTVAKKELDKLAARAVTEASLQSLLRTCLDEALSRTQGPSRRLALKPLDTSEPSPRYRQGWYVDVQNFERLAAAKASRDDRFMRLRFGAVQYADAPQPWLEVLVWHPSHGPASGMRPLFIAEADQGKDMFVQWLTTALSLISTPHKA